ncbi:toluene tolerance protein [Pseudomonas sp. BN417]|uniref:toluene tolerance protein n=1 Tax=Pseudomonas sp. BN417 TaxID=2567890 RepID=UPI002456DE03|nr:toluene tolerance protein [Pseudomonas sp. BN417]MDH4555057.1 toluene tolerance protein [Pseudomonas sp. BN417]
MQALDHDTYLKLSAGADVLERDRYGEKVLRLTDGSFLKLFRRKRLLSSAALYPYAQRFADNAILLQARNVPCPRILGVYRIGALARDVVHYQPLPGKTLRQLYETRDEELNHGLKGRLGSFIARLHEQGIYFRSLHLGNVILTPDDNLGLIDFADLKGQAGPLGKGKRLRNFRHLLRYTEDRHWLLTGENQTFFEAYLADTGLSAKASFVNQLKSL